MTTKRVWEIKHLGLRIRSKGVRLRWPMGITTREELPSIYL